MFGRLFGAGLFFASLPTGNTRKFFFPVVMADPMQEQLDLQPPPVTPEIVYSKRTLTDAIKLSIEVSTRPEQAIRHDLDISPSHWSRIFTARTQYFPPDQIDQLCDLTGNDIPLDWLAYRRRKGTYLLESEMQRQLRELKEQLAERDKEMATIKKFVKETRAP